MRADLLGLGLAVCITLACATARSQTAEEQAGALFNEAVEHFAAEEFEAASELLLQAYALDPNPRLAYNLGRALDRAGRSDEALTYYRLSASDRDDTDLVARASEGIARIEGATHSAHVVVVAGELAPELQAGAAAVAERRAERARMGTLSVNVAGASGALVQVDDRPPHRAPATVALEPGSHRVVVWHDDSDETWQRDVDIASSETTRVDVRFGDASPRGHGLRNVGFGALGLGAAGIGLGVAMYGSAQSSYDDAVALAASGTDRAGFDDAVSSGRSSATISNIAYGVGAAAMAAGVALIVVDITRDGEGSAVSGSVSALPGGMAFGVSF